MDIEKLKETLKANGIDDETIAKIIADMEKKPEEGEKPQEGDEPKGDEPQGEGDPEKGEPTPTPEDVNPEDVPSENNEGDPQGEGELPPDEEVPPTPNPEELPPEVPPEVVPPTPEEPGPEVPPVPPFDPTELLGKIDEMGKSIEGLLARIGSLEDALKGAGVLEKSDDENIGFENQGLPGTSSVGADSAMVSALAKLNNHR